MILTHFLHANLTLNTHLLGGMGSEEWDGGCSSPTTRHTHVKKKKKIFSVFLQLDFDVRQRHKSFLSLQPEANIGSQRVNMIET